MRDVIVARKVVSHTDKTALVSSERIDIRPVELNTEGGGGGRTANPVRDRGDLIGL
jgi:hypothetical protein